jgi:hypothetical protein
LDFQPLAPRNEASDRPSSVHPRKNGSKHRDEKTQEARQLKLQAFEHSRQMGLTLDMLKQKSNELASLVELVAKSKDHGTALMAQNTQLMWRATAAEEALSAASSNCEALAHALESLKKHAAAEQSAAAKQHTANAQKIEALEKSVTKLQAVSKLQVEARDQQAKIREQPQLLTPALRVARPDLSLSSSGIAKPVNAASLSLKPPAVPISPAPVIVASGATKLAVAADSSGSQLAAATSSSSPPAPALSAPKVSLATSSDQPVSVLRVTLAALALPTGPAHQVKAPAPVIARQPTSAVLQTQTREQPELPPQDAWPDVSMPRPVSAPAPPRASIDHEAPQVPIHWQGVAPPMRKTMTAQLTERDVQPFLAAARAVAKVHDSIPGDTYRFRYHRGEAIGEVELKPPYRFFGLDFDESVPGAVAYIDSLPYMYLARPFNWNTAPR